MKQTKTTTKNKHTDIAIRILLSSALLILFAIQAQSQERIEDHIRIIGPANFSCFGYHPSCMDKTIELCNRQTIMAVLNQNTFRYDFGQTERLSKIQLLNQENDIITTTEEIDTEDMSCRKNTTNNQTGLEEETPAPCTFTRITTTPNITKKALSISQNKRFDGAVEMPPGTCLNLTVRPDITENLRRQDFIEYNITFLNHVLDPFVSKYNLTQDFNSTEELNTTSPTLNNATMLNGTLYSNWSKNTTYLNNTNTSYPWNCTSTVPIQGAGCLGIYGQTCGTDDINKEWIMGCGSFCRGATIMIDIGQKATIYGFEFQVNNNVALSYMETYVSDQTYPIGLNSITCSGSNCDTNFENFSQDMVMNTTSATQYPTCGNATLNFTPKEGRYIYLRAWGANGNANPRMGEVRPLIADFTTGSSVQSVTYNLSKNISSIRFAINRTLNGGTVGINISCNAGATWCNSSTSDGGTISCCGGTKNDAITYRLALDGTGSYLRPSIQRLNIEAFESSQNETINESQARSAIEQGVQEVFPNATLATQQKLYIRYLNSTQRYAVVDKYFANGNKRWIFNYLNANDTTIAMTGLGTSVYVWENQSLTTDQIIQQVRTLVNQTK